MFKQTKNGICLLVKVIPKSNKTEIIKIEKDLLKIKINKPQDKQKANLKLIKFLAKIFKTFKENIEIIGKKSKTKRIIIKNINIEEADRFLKEHISNSILDL